MTPLSSRTPRAASPRARAATSSSAAPTAGSPGARCWPSICGRFRPARGSSAPSSRCTSRRPRAGRSASPSTACSFPGPRAPRTLATTPAAGRPPCPATRPGVIASWPPHSGRLPAATSIRRAAVRSNSALRAATSSPRPPRSSRTCRAGWKTHPRTTAGSFAASRASERPAKRLFSREHDDPELRPRLTIENRVAPGLQFRGVCSTPRNAPQGEWLVSYSRFQAEYPPRSDQPSASKLRVRSPRSARSPSLRPASIAWKEHHAAPTVSPWATYRAPARWR